MKTLVTTLLLLISFATISQAQNTILKTNEVNVRIEIEDETPVLYWTLNKEVNSSYFLIERSVDGKEFTVIHTKTASGSTYGKTEYSYEDLGTKEANAVYRVTMVTMDGTKWVSNEDSNNDLLIAQSDSLQ